MNKICCDDFRWRYETGPEMGLNIRVARIMNNSKPDDISFFVTEGYIIGAKRVKFCKINYCPFCGTKLSKYYKSNNMINSQIEDFAKL